MRRYLCVVEIDVDADDDLAAATEAVRKLKQLETPQIYVRPIDDSLEPWIGVDFAELDDNGQPYICATKPLCFDFAE